MADNRVLVLKDRAKLVRFEREVLPHLDAAHNLARWLTGNDADAADVVQEACLRALSFFDGFRGPEARAWLLQIVRNTCYTWLRRNRAAATEALDETALGVRAGSTATERMILSQAIGALPAEFREALVLREMEGLSYKDIAHVVGVPIGTVMSRIARARKLLREYLSAEAAS